MKIDNTPEDYLAWLRSVTWGYQLVGSGGEDQVYRDAPLALTLDTSKNVAAELAKYNALDRDVDLAWGQQFLALNDYYRQGQFAPGAPTATLEVMAQARQQWAHDAEPGMLDKVIVGAIVAAAAWATYGIATGGAAAVPAISAPASMAEEMAALGVPYTGETAAIADIVASVPAYDYAGYEVAAPTAEQITAATAEVSGAGTATTKAVLQSAGKSALEILGTAKSVLGAAGTVATIAKLVTGATAKNPATGLPYGLPPGYQPIVTPGAGSAAGMPLDYSGIIKQLALPALGLLAVFLLKG